MADLNSPIAGAQPTVEDMARDMGLRRFLLGIYQKMALGLVVTGVIAWAVSQSPTMSALLYTSGRDGINGYTAFGLCMVFAPLVLSLMSNLFMRSLNVAVMAGFYWLFVAVMGVSISSIFLLYGITSIASMFLITAGAFGALSLYGYTTKVNMTGWGSFLMMAIFGIIIASLVNFFLLKSPMLDFGISVVCVLVFSVLIAFRTQWLKATYYQMQVSQRGLAALTYFGALSLYISFMNVFLSLLRIFGGGRR